MKFIKIAPLIFTAISIFAFYSCQTEKQCNFDGMSGKLLFLSADDENKEGYSIYDFAKAEEDFIGINGLSGCFFNNSNQIILDIGVGTIVKYNVDTKEQELIYQIESPNASSQYSLAVVDNNSVSVGTEEGIIIIDVDTLETITVVDDNYLSEHGWDDEGKILTYTIKTNSATSICEYHTITGEKKVLFDGMRPKVSKNGNIIVYQQNNDKEFALTVRDISSGKEYNYPNGVLDYVISPDGKYIAVIENWKGAGFYKGYTVNVWDYSSDNIINVIEKCPNFATIDWTE